jgi:hypothetical protein
MRKLFGVALVAALFIALPARAEDVIVGTLTSTGTSVTNASTAVPFYQTGIRPSASTGFTHAAIQCDGAAYVTTVTTAAGTVSAATGVKLAADQLYDDDLTGPLKWLAMISVTGTVNCKVFRHTEVAWLLPANSTDDPLFAAFTWPASFRGRADQWALEYI